MTAVDLNLIDAQQSTSDLAETRSDGREAFAELCEALRSMVVEHWS